MQMPTEYSVRCARRTTTLRIRGVDHAVYEWGSDERPLLVYLHGFGDAAATFQFVVDALQADWFVVAPDWRGFGRSAGNAHAYWFPDYLADLDELLQHYSPAAPVRLIGHSMGGNVASLYAGAMPERVASLINLEGFGLPDTKPTEAPARYRRWLQLQRRRSPFGSYDSFDALARKIRGKSPRMTAAQADFVAREWAAVADDGRIRLRADPAHKLPYPVLYRREEAEACWRSVKAPVLLVVGRDSRYQALLELPFADQITHWIENSGHMLHFEQPAAVARAIEDFLRETATDL